jgi:3',5'-cyclic AMP phosphodiesterase CpdA
MIKLFHAQPGKIDLVLISGDLVEQGSSEQQGAMKEILKALNMPYYVVVGNHDYLGQADRQAYDQLHPGRLNYHFEHQGWQFVGLDTSEGTKSQNVKAPQATLDWLDENLPKLDKQKPTIVFTHFPLGFGVPFILQNANEILKRLVPYNLQAVYSGHYHGFTEKTAGTVVMTTNKCCSFARANHDKTPEKGFFVCSAKDGKVTRRFVEMK